MKYSETGRKVLHRVLKTLAYIWFTLALLTIIVGLIVVLMKEGVGNLWDVLSPFNIWNYIAVFLIFLPGLIMLFLAEKLEA